jgi:glutaredoxin-like YruB-family protein
MKEVTIYTTPTCHWCAVAKEFLNSHNVPFKQIDVAADRAAAMEMVKMTGQMGVPVIVIGEDVMVGYQEAKMTELLGLGEQKMAA